MAMFERQRIVDRLRAEITAGRAVYDALCGSGITAKMAALGGADLITTFNLAYYRMQDHISRISLGRPGVFASSR